MTAGRGRLIQCNFCSRLSGWLQNGYHAADPRARQDNAKLLKESVQTCLQDGTLKVFAGWMVFFGVVFYFCFQRILRTPEVRRE